VRAEVNAEKPVKDAEHGFVQARPDFELCSRTRRPTLSAVVTLAFIIVAVVGYLLGSIPTGFLVAKARGVDIRTVGSKNMGATNVFRVLGKGPGIFVLLVDALKGTAAILFAGEFSRRGIPLSDCTCEFWNQDLAMTLGGLCAILGHNYTCWLGFKGGKGIATSAGVFFTLAPLACSIALAAWIVSFLVTRYVSVASIVAAVALPTAVVLTQTNVALSVVTVVIGALAIYKHRANIQRLMAGTENRFQFSRKQPTQ
jgi:acyl phosphate:glycerol-3-phosphate acyltransferase